MPCSCPNCNGNPEMPLNGFNGFNHMVDSWIGMSQLCPRNPLDLIAFATFGGVVGSYLNSSTYINPPAGSWTTDTTVITAEPTCSALGTDNQQMVADAQQWNVKHRTADLGANIPPEMRKFIFLRGGTQWKMRINLDTAAAVDVQLSFRNNAGTRGDMQGTIPVIHFEGPFDSGAKALEITLKALVQAHMGLRINLDGNNYAMFSSEWNIVV